MKKLLLPLILLVIGYVAGVIKSHSVNPLDFGPKTSIAIAFSWAVLSGSWVFMLCVVDDLVKKGQADDLFNSED